MTMDLLNGLEEFMIRPETIEFYRNLPVDKQKELEGLEGFALASAIEEMAYRAKIESVFETFPASEKRKLSKLKEEERLKFIESKIKLAEEATYSSERQMAKSTADYIKKNAVAQQMSLLAPYPHDLARRSVFFIEENENMKRDLLDGFVIGSGSWGLTTYSGKKLFTADEKAWVVLLGLAAEHKKRGAVDWHVVKGSIRNFLREAGLPESGQYSERFVESIQAMQGGIFRFEGKSLPKSDGKQRKRPLKERIEGWHLISSFSVDNTSNQFVIVLDRAFIETFIAEFHMYARLNIKQFCKQPPTASALHRFFAGHTPGPDGCIRMNLFLVAKATNMLTEYPNELEVWPNADVKYSKKRTISRALTRLVKDETFGPRTGIKTRKRGEDDLVIIDTELAGKLVQSQKKKALPRKIN